MRLHRESNGQSVNALAPSIRSSHDRMLNSIVPRGVSRFIRGLGIDGDVLLEGQLVFARIVKQPSQVCMRFPCLWRKLRSLLGDRIQMLSEFLPVLPF